MTKGMPILMQNSSQMAGSMRRSPSSNCCQLRSERCTSTPAADCDSPAFSRAARMSAGRGLRAAEAARERLGWLVTARQGFDGVLAVRPVVVDDVLGRLFFDTRFHQPGDGGVEQLDLFGGETIGVFGIEHFRLQPLNPEARLSCIDASHVTHIVRSCNEKIFMRGRHGAYGAKPSNV